MTDRQTDGRTSHDGIDRAMQSVARVMQAYFIHFMTVNDV